MMDVDGTGGAGRSGSAATAAAAASICSSTTFRCAFAAAGEAGCARGVGTAADASAPDAWFSIWAASVGGFGGDAAGRLVSIAGDSVSADGAGAAGRELSSAGADAAFLSSSVAGASVISTSGASTALLEPMLGSTTEPGATLGDAGSFEGRRGLLVEGAALASSAACSVGVDVAGSAAGMPGTTVKGSVWLSTDVAVVD